MWLNFKQWKLERPPIEKIGDSCMILKRRVDECRGQFHRFKEDTWKEGRSWF